MRGETGTGHRSRQRLDVARRTGLER